MLAAKLADAFGRMTILGWCGPEECLSLLYTSRGWCYIGDLRDAALFALSRTRAPVSHTLLRMHDWHQTWNECRDVFRKKNWPLVLWRDACCFLVRGCSFEAHEPFYAALDEMVHTRYPALSVCTVLATTLSIHPYEIHALLLLSFGFFAFVGSTKCCDADSGAEESMRMICNIIAARSLLELEDEAIGAIASRECTHIDVPLSPWYLDEDGSLKICFCYEGMCTQNYVYIEDAFLPWRNDAASWRSPFTHQYLRVASYGAVRISDGNQRRGY